MLLPFLLANTIDTQNLHYDVCTNLENQLNQNNVIVESIPIYGSTTNSLVACKLTADKSNLNKAANLIKDKVIIDLGSNYKILTVTFTVDDSLTVYVSNI